VVLRPLFAATLVVRRRYLIAVPRPMPEAPRIYLIVVYRPLAAAPLVVRCMSLRPRPGEPKMDPNPMRNETNLPSFGLSTAADCSLCNSAAPPTACTSTAHLQLLSLQANQVSPLWKDDLSTRLLYV